MWGIYPWGASSWAGAKEPVGTGGVITDPAFPESPGWRWKTQTGPRPWGTFAYSGGGVSSRPTTGGIAVLADPSTASILLTAWWAAAPYLRITRIVGADRQPVRGGDPLSVITATRTNMCTNPSFEVDTSGWLAGANTTMSRLTAISALAGTAAGRFQANGAGAINLTVPVQVPTQVFGISFALYLSAQPSGALTATVAWQDATATALTPSVATIATGNLATHVGRWARTPVLDLSPPAGAMVGVLTLQVAGNAATAKADIDAVLIESGVATSGVYFDGDTAYGAWTGTAHASSQLAAAQQIIDREAPLDVPVRYELTAPDQPASIIQSEPITLASNDRTWLYAPSSDTLLNTWVTAEPGMSRKIERGVFPTIGRANPIAVSASIRQSTAGSLEVVTENFGDRDRLWAVLEDGMPLLLRAPARLGHGPGEWISVGDVEMKASGHGAWEGPRIWSLPYQVVDPPASATAA